MQQRPESVLVVSILCILYGFLGFLCAFPILGLHDSMPTWQVPDKWTTSTIVLIVATTDSVTSLLCGIYFLQGANWARWVFVGEAVLSNVVKVCFLMATYKYYVTTLAFMIITGVVVFLPNATEFFTGRSNRHRRRRR